jgi:hypothetical protein
MDNVQQDNICTNVPLSQIFKSYKYYVSTKHNIFYVEVSTTFGRAIAQAVSRRLPTATARVQTRVWSCGIL